MAQKWEKDGEKNGIQQWKLTVTSDKPGVPISVYRGSKSQIASQLADSQVFANERIREQNLILRGQTKTETPPKAAAPTPLTDAERMQVVADINNPAKVDAAIARVVESKTGPLEAVRESAANAPEERQERDNRLATEAATQFAAETPEYYPTDFNARTMAQYIKIHGDLRNRAHYTQAYNDLSAAGLLQKRPEGEEENEDEATLQGRNAPTPAALPKSPTRISTGIRSRDVSGLEPRPTNKLKFTREQIAKMSARTYKEHMRDPEFQRAVEFYANTPMRKAS